MFAAAFRTVSPPDSAAQCCATMSVSACTAPPAALWSFKTYIRCSYLATAAASFCWCLEQQAASRDENSREVQFSSFLIRNKEPLPRKYWELVYQFLLTWKYNMNFPLLSEERFWQHTPHLHMSSNRVFTVLFYLVFSHVVLFIAKLVNCNWKGKDPAGNKSSLLV